MRQRHTLLGLMVVMLAFAPGGPLGSQPAQTEKGLLAEGARRLGEADFRKRYVGNTLSGTTAQGEAFHVYIVSRTSYRMVFQGKRSEDRWIVGKQGEFCATAGSETTCTREYAHKQMIYSFNADGTLAGTARIRRGNAEGL